MKTMELVSILATVVSLSVALITTIRMYRANKESNKFKVTRKDTGKSVVISRYPDQFEGQKLLELVK